ncbi:MAG: hypothetical protein ACI4O7_07565 [Aristaeellaceae bacterium]
MPSEPSPWRHQARNAFDQLCLHDCVISSFALEDGDLVLSLDNGFQALTGAACNPGSKVLRTGPAQLRFRGVETLYDLSCQRELCLFGHTCLLLWENAAPDAILRLMRAGRLLLLALDMHTAGGSLIFTGTFRQRWRPFGLNRRFFYWPVYGRPPLTVDFFWNDLQPERGE